MAPDSQWERMVSGALYRPYAPELQAARLRARRLTWRYNATPPDDQPARQGILRELFAAIGTHCEIEPPFHCDYGSLIRLGHNVFMNFGCVILDGNEVTIGNGVLMAPNVQISAATHPLDAETRRQGLESAQPVRIDDHVWLATGVIVGPGVTIGENSVIGAGSVVVRDIPANVLAVGNPCRVIRPLPAKAA